MPNYPQIKYTDTDVIFYKTNLYDSGTNPDIDNATPRFTDRIDLIAKTGINISFKFDASGSTDELILKLFRNHGDTLDGDENPIRTIQIANNGSETIFSFSLDALQCGAGYYWFSMESEAANDTFDMIITGRYWRFEIATS